MVNMQRSMNSAKIRKTTMRKEQGGNAKKMFIVHLSQKVVCVCVCKGVCMQYEMIFEAKCSEFHFYFSVFIFILVFFLLHLNIWLKSALHRKWLHSIDIWRYYHRTICLFAFELLHFALLSPLLLHIILL